MTSRPHVSQAIVQLRLWVWFAAALLVLAAATEMLVFGFVHYTDTRFTVLENKPEKVPAEIVRNAAALREAAPPLAAPPAAVVATAPAPAAPGAEPTAAPAAPVALVTPPPAPVVVPAKPADVNRVASAADRSMEKAIQIASTAGVIAAVWLMMLTVLGLVVGAGAAVPGIERAVTAAAWSIVLALLCLPLKDWLPSMPWRGVFGSYREMTAASEAVRETATGTPALLAIYVGLPMVALIGGVFVGVWFRTGVERGVILSTAQQIDEALERELATVRSRGVAGNAPRAMSALTRTIGEPVGIPAQARVAAGAEGLATASVSAESQDLGRWRIGAPVPGSPEKRPI